MNYLNILKSKPHNPHYLNKYIKFIESCKSKNSLSENLGQTEIHHICPKADDLFPEFINLKKNPWNSIILTTHQHILAHVILWKTYGGSQLTSLYYMLNIQNSETKYNDRKIPTSLTIRYAVKIREEYFASRKGKACYKDSDNNKYLLHNDDPLIQELNLVGNNKGLVFSEESKENLRRSKDTNRKTKLYFLDKKVSVKINSDEYDKLIEEGWHNPRTPEDYDYIDKLRYEKVSDKMSGRARYCYPNGTFYGMITKEDPAIKEFNLVWMDTDNAKDQRKRRQTLAAEALTGSEIYNNGSIEIRFKSGDDTNGWNKGRLERTELHKENFANAIQQANLNKTYWNNGIICKKLPNGEFPGEGWSTGMLPRNKK